MKTTKLFLSALFIGVIAITSCSGPEEEKEVITTIFSVNANAEDSLIDPPSRHQGDAHSGQFAYRTDSASQYGATVIYNINDSILNSGLRIVTDFWAKSTNPVKGDGLAVSFQDNEKIYQWTNIDPIAYGAKPNEWIHIVDSINIPADQVVKSGLLLKFFSFNANKIATVDLDDINISVKRVQKIIEE